MTFEYKDVELSTGRLRYAVGGGGEGSTLLYLHSAGGQRVTPALELLAKNHQIFTPVFPGFDGTEAHKSVKTMQGLADLAYEFEDKVIGHSCDVMGQSFGSWVGVWYGILHPNTDQQLVLECPAGFRTADAPDLSNDPHDIVSRMYAYPERRPPDKPANVMKANREILHYYHGPTKRDEDAISRLGEIEALCLIILGTKDTTIVPECGQLLRHNIPKSLLTYVYDAAHNIETDQPERFAGLVADFLERGIAFIVNPGSSDKVTARN